MSRTASPLRYPGGKSSLLKAVSSILRSNQLDRGHYVEPFAGGAGLALSLLFKGNVGELHLNDVDPAIAAFWRTVLEDADVLIEMMHATPVTIEQRQVQREKYLTHECSQTELAFATLFLNRVNRSGIIRTGGVIGGLAQTGNYLIDCRFNKADLESRIRRIARYKSRIHFSSLDANAFLIDIEGTLPKRSLIYADPPYFQKGAELYTSSFRPADHGKFRDTLTAIETPWILTYDNVPEIRSLYEDLPQQAFDLFYSAQTKRMGSELLVSHAEIVVPKNLFPQSTETPVTANEFNEAA